MYPHPGGARTQRTSEEVWTGPDRWYCSTKRAECCSCQPWTTAWPPPSGSMTTSSPGESWEESTPCLPDSACGLWCTWATAELDRYVWDLGLFGFGGGGGSGGDGDSVAVAAATAAIFVSFVFVLLLLFLVVVGRGGTGVMLWRFSGSWDMYRLIGSFSSGFLQCSVSFLIRGVPSNHPYWYASKRQTDVHPLSSNTSVFFLSPFCLFVCCCCLSF